MKATIKRWTLNLNARPRRSTLIWAAAADSVVFVLWLSYIQSLNLAQWATIALTIGVPALLVTAIQAFLAVLEAKERRRARAAGEPLVEHGHAH